MAENMYLVKLMKYDDVYMKTYMAESMLNTPEMKGLGEMARKHGFRIEMERLNTMEDMENFLEGFSE